MAIEIGGQGATGGRDLTPAVIMPGGDRDWSRFMFNLGLASLILVVLLSSALYIWHNFVLKARLARINNEISQLEAAQQSQEAQKFVVVQGQLRSLREILSNHVYASEFFTWLENLTHKQVSFSNTSINFETGQVSLNGLAASEDVLAQQLEIFEGDNEVIEASIQSIQLTAQGIGFSLSIEFDTSLVKR